MQNGQDILMEIRRETVPKTVWSENMGKIMEEIVSYEKVEAAKRMLKRGKLTKEEIAEGLDLPLSVVESLESNLQPA